MGARTNLLNDWSRMMSEEECKRRASVACRSVTPVLLTVEDADQASLFQNFVETIRDYLWNSRAINCPELRIEAIPLEYHEGTLTVAKNAGVKISLFNLNNRNLESSYFTRKGLNGVAEVILREPDDKGMVRFEYRSTNPSYPQARLKSLISFSLTAKSVGQMGDAIERIDQKGNIEGKVNPNNIQQLNNFILLMNAFVAISGANVQPIKRQQETTPTTTGKQPKTMTP